MEHILKYCRQRALMYFAPLAPASHLLIQLLTAGRAFSFLAVSIAIVFRKITDK